MVSGFLAGAAGGAAVTIVINAIDNYSTVFANVNKTLVATGVAMTALGVAGLMMSKNLIDTAASFETAFTGVRKTVELSEGEFAKLRGEFKNLSKEIPITFQELSSIGEIAGQLGVSGVDNLKKFTETIAAIGVTTNMTAEAAATSFARIANVMQLPLTEVDRMGSSIVELGNNFATTEGEITNFAERIAGAGNVAGLTTQDILAIGTAMTSVGVEAEAGGTAVQKVLLQMNAAVIEGNDDLKVFAKTSGMTSKEFEKSWRDDAGGAFASFVMGLGTQGDDALGTLDELQLKDVRLTRAFLSLANAGDLVTKTIETSNKSWEENNALTAEAEKRYATTESQVLILTNKFNSLKDDMGQALIPAFIKIIDVLSVAIGWLEKHPTLTKWAIAAVAIGSALALIVGPLLILVAMLPLLTAGFAVLSAVSLPITLTILAIAAAVVAVVAGIVMLVKWLKKLKSQSLLDDQEEFNRMNPNLAIKNDTIDLDKGSDSINRTIDLNKGSSTNINIENIYGVDSEQVSDALGKEIKNVIRL